MDFSHLSLITAGMPILSMVLVAIFILPAIKLARFLNLIDTPEGRKQHDKAVPPIGGLIVFPVFMTLSLVAGINLNTYWPLYVSLILLLMTGAFDDRAHVPALLKFFIHCVAAGIIVIFGGVQVMYLGDLIPGYGDVVWIGAITIPFSIIAVVLLVNAMNLIDGLDGLAGGISFVMFGFISLGALSGGLPYASDVLMIYILMGALAGFLIFNMRNPWRRKAALFLGDAGSMCLGLTLAWFSVKLAKSPEMPLEPMTIAWILGLPIMDACAQFYRRVRNGRDPFSPDRGHLHHHFIDAGVSVKMTTPIIITIVLVMSAIGYGGQVLGVHDGILALLWAALLLVHMAVSYKPERYKKLITKLLL